MTTLKTGARAADVTYGTLNSTIWSTIGMSYISLVLLYAGNINLPPHRHSMIHLGACPMFSDGISVLTHIRLAEANTAIICACLPMLKAPLARLFPRLFPRGSSGSDRTSPSISTTCRPGHSLSSLNAACHKYDSWGRLQSKRQMGLVSGSFARNSITWLGFRSEKTRRGSSES